MTVECAECDESIQPGEHRIPASDGPKHYRCDPPERSVGLYEDLERVTVEIADEEIPGTVAGSGQFGLKIIARVELDDVPPGAKTDVLEIESERESGQWTDSVAFNMVPTFDEEDGVSFVESVDRRPISGATIQLATAE